MSHFLSHWFVHESMLKIKPAVKCLADVGSVSQSSPHLETSTVFNHSPFAVMWTVLQSVVMKVKVLKLLVHIRTTAGVGLISEVQALRGDPRVFISSLICVLLK